MVPCLQIAARRLVQPSTGEANSSSAAQVSTFGMRYLLSEGLYMQGAWAAVQEEAQGAVHTLQPLAPNDMQLEVVLCLL